MDFKEAEQFIYSLSNIPRKEYMIDPRGCSVYLERLQFFLDILGNPESKIEHYIHVGGTSGKGSTISFLHNILLADGKNVGSYISPHPTEITQRWKVGNTIMSQKEFVEIVKQIKPSLQTYIETSPYDMLSFFELNVAMTLLYFSKKNINWAILEVGCGGLFDGTNVIPYKDVAVITNVGLDHTALLGKTIPTIAKRKAGIITPRSHVFTADVNKKTIGIIKEHAKKRKAKSFTKVKGAQHVLTTNNEVFFTYNKKEYRIETIGRHQANNAALAISIAEKLSISEKNIRKGLLQARQTARMELVSESPLIILDSAHNPDKMQSSIDAILDIEDWREKSVKLVVGFSENKDWKKMMEQLKKLNVEHLYITRQTQNPFRSTVHLPTLEEKAEEIFKGKKVTIHIDPQNALALAKKELKKSDILLVTGSLFLSGELRPNLTKKEI
jgi:dihydrofolate synthase / folylpolyglutamate synthase